VADADLESIMTHRMTELAACEAIMPLKTLGVGDSRKGEHSAADDGHGNGAIVAMFECLCTIYQ